MADPKVCVLRLGHREPRDKRVTTHLFLTARAFGADKILYAGQRDERLEERIQKVVKTWGGSLQVEYERNWRKTIENWKSQGGEVIHLTMYGLPILEIINLIRESSKDKLVIIGGPKVPRNVFELADWNISVTSQPHSEISALCIFLHELFQGKELSQTFNNGKMRIIPQARAKKVVHQETEN